jgi:DNA-binding NtrC family response regulator
MLHIALHVGLDPTLSYTRQKILQSMGCTAVACFSAADAVQFFRDGDFDFVMLCHSLPREERQELTRLFHMWSPSTPIILVRWDREADSLVDAVLDSDPEQMVRQLSQVIGHITPSNSVA